MKRMKKILSLLLALALALLATLPVSAETVEPDGLAAEIFSQSAFESAMARVDSDCMDITASVPSTDTVEVTDGVYWYEIQNDEAALVDVRMDIAPLTGAVEVPSEVDGYPVTTIRNGAFGHEDGITELVFPETVRCIEDYAVGSCSALTRMIVPASATELGAYFVRNCSSLMMLYIEGKRNSLVLKDYPMPVYCDIDIEAVDPDERMNLPYCLYPLAELHYDPLTAEEQTEGNFSFILADGKATVTKAPFDNVVVIPDTLGGAPVCYLAPNLFTAPYPNNAPRYLQQVTLPQTVEELPTQCFQYCSSLQKINLSQVRSFGYRCFVFCERLQQVDLSSCEYVGVSAFGNCNLQQIDLPEGCTYIGDSAFAANRNCTAIHLPSTLTRLGVSAFSETPTEQPLVIPESLTEIPDYAFYKSAKNSITLHDRLEAIGCNAFGFCGCRTLEIPGSVSEIGNGAFGNAEKLESAVVREGVCCLGASVFAGCNAMTALQLPESLTVIGDYAFSFCQALPSLTIPGKVTVCGDAFHYSAIPVVYGRSDAVADAATASGCRYIDLDTGAEAVPAYDKTVSGVTYRVRYSSAILVSGKNAKGSITIPESVDGRTVTEIAERAFYRSSKVTAISMPDTVTKLGNGAFEECEKLSELRFSNALTVLPPYVCRRCKVLQTVELPHDLVEIGESAFFNCTSLETISVPLTLKRIGNYAFERSSLTSFFVPPSVETIGYEAFNETALSMLYLSPNFRYDNLYGWPGEESTLQHVAENIFYVYHPGTPAEEYVEKLNEREYTEIHRYWLPENEQIFLSTQGVYRLDGDHMTLIFLPIRHLSASAKTVAVDPYVGGIPVTTIGPRAFQHWPKYTMAVNIILTPVVTTIQANAFSDMDGGMTVYIPKSVTKIADSAFSGTQQNTICGQMNTAASRFASSHGIPFSPLQLNMLPFTDVQESAWYYTGVFYAYYNGLMKGESSLKFSPGKSMTRAMLVQVLYNLSGSYCPPYGFTDVPSTAWYAQAVNWAAATGIVNGVSETKFAPNQAVTREQMVTILRRYALQFGPADGNPNALSTFEDAKGISDFAVDAMRWAVTVGLIQGVTATSIRPQGRATRAQIATVLMRFIQYMTTR